MVFITNQKAVLYWDLMKNVHYVMVKLIIHTRLRN